jgi:thiol-disulfide isomerase/thioredoxin
MSISVQNFKPSPCAARTREAAWLLVALIGLAVAGCDGSTFSGSSAETFPDVKLRSVSAAELGRVIRSQQGRVVLVDFWATWCGPCRQLFPHNVALQRQFVDKGLSVLTVSVDDAGNETEVKRFLQANGGATENFLAKEVDLQDRSNPFGLADGIPLIKIYDRQGTLRNTIVGRREDEIDSAVQTLLAEK